MGSTPLGRAGVGARASGAADCEMHTRANSSIEFRASERRATVPKIARRIRWQTMRAALFVALVVVWGLICVAAVIGMLAIAI
jgi:hypothetical protein